MTGQFIQFRFRLICAVIGLLLTITLPNLVLAQANSPGVTDGSVIIGQNAGFTGPQAGVAKENLDGAHLYFDIVNNSGGVNGRKIILKSLDDANSPAKAAENTKKLIENENAFALFMFRSTPNTEAALPVLTAAKVPLVGAVTGANSLHEPFNRYIFHVRAKYRAEGAKIIEQLTTMGITRIAVLASDDSFGLDGFAGVTNALKDKQMSALAVGKYDRNTLKMDDAVHAIAPANPQAVVMICTAKACAEFVHEMRKANSNPQFFTLSNTSSQTFINDLGEDGRGVGVTQVWPYPWDKTTPVVREIQAALKGDDTTVSYAMLEGFITAKVLVEGLRRAGPKLTRDRFISALESMNDYDAGGFRISYSPTNHDGSTFIDLTMIGKGGRFLR